MELSRVVGLCLILLSTIIVFSGGVTAEKGVTYDGRSLIIDGQRKLLFSGSIHYPRSTPEVNIFHHIYNLMWLCAIFSVTYFLAN